MVYDLGGGTFDVSIIEIGEGVIDVLSTSGDNHLGGDDFDERIAEWILRNFKAKYRTDLSKDFSAMQRIREAAEQTKKELSTSSTSNINLPYLTQIKGEPVHLELTLTRAVFNELIQDLIERTQEPVQNALNDAGLQPSDLGRVLLVGGSTRIPAVQDMVRRLTGKEPSRNINPDECVAKGAAILGSALEGNALAAAGTGQSLLLMDVTPLSLSIETLGGVSTCLIKRNSTIPTRYSKIFTTAVPYQSSVDIHVLQGERPMAKDNKTIGKFRLKGIRKAMAGVPQIEVTFDIDVNGILKVSAKDLDTGKAQSITITAGDRMSDAEIEQAMQDAREYAGQDQLRRDALELIGDAQKTAVQARRVLKEQDKIMDKARKKQLKKDVSVLEKALSKIRVDKVSEEDMAGVRSAMQTVDAELGAEVQQ